MIWYFRAGRGRDIAHFQHRLRFKLFGWLQSERSLRAALAGR